MAILITGVAGFVGSNLAKFFLDAGKTVFGVDNLSRGDCGNLSICAANRDFYFAELDVNDIEALKKWLDQLVRIEDVEEVWHLAANSDIPAGITSPNVDLRDTFLSTFNTIEVMKCFDIGTMIFASSSALYGDLGAASLSESSGPLLPISNYGAMKLASEALISASVEGFLDRAFIFRFPNVIGIPATHGVILDFVRKLRDNPQVLHVLGDGSQKKSYLHVEDLLRAMIFVRHHSNEKLTLINIGPSDSGVTVKFIAEQVVAEFSSSAMISYGRGMKGWVGDVPRFFYSTEKLLNLGWNPTMTSEQAVKRAVKEIISQESQGR